MKLMNDKYNRFVFYIIIVTLIMVGITVKYVKENLVETYYGKQVDLKLRAK